MPPPDDELPPAAGIATGIDHILEDIVIHCDIPTLATLRGTCHYVRDIVDTRFKNPPGKRCIHVEVHEKNDALNIHIFVPSISPARTFEIDMDRLDGANITCLDVIGDAYPQLTKIATPRAQTARLFADVPHPSDCHCDDHLTGPKIYYPRTVPRSRTMVVFPPKDRDGSKVALNSPVEFSLAGTGDWVFDRLVYHTLATNVSWTYQDEGKTFILSPAWNTVFVSQPRDSVKPLSRGVLDSVAHAALVALASQDDVPGARVTVVADCFRTLRDEDQPPPNKRYRLESSSERQRKRVFSAVRARLINEYGDGHRNTLDDPGTVVNCISWDEYEASLTPRQFELETVP